MTPRRAQIASLAALGLHFSLAPSVIHWSLQGADAYRASSAVVIGDAMKLAAGLCIAAWQARVMRNVDSQSKRRTSTVDMLRTAIFAPGWLRLSIPALLFTCQNVLSYHGMALLPPSLFTSAVQLKILTSAIFSGFLLGRHLNARQWSALLMLTVSVAIVESSGTRRAGSLNAAEDGISMTGLVAALLSTVISGYANTYLESKLKQTDPSGNVLGHSLAVRNVQLSAFGVIIALALAASSDGFTGFWLHFGRAAWAVCAMQALGGYLVALALRHADSVSKSFATALGLVSSAVLSTTWFGYAPSASLAVGFAGVLAGTTLYVRASQAGAAQPVAAQRGARAGVARGRLSRVRSRPKLTLSFVALMAVAAFYGSSRYAPTWAHRAVINLDLSQCGQSPCRFLLLASVAEEGDAAEVRALSAARLARRLDRILIVPNTARGRYSICLPPSIDSGLDAMRFTKDAQINRTITFSDFARYAHRRSLFGRSPLISHYIVVTARAGSNRLPDLVDASVGFTALPEWHCMRGAALTFERQVAPQLLRPGIHAAAGNPLGLTRHGEFIERALSTPAMRKGVDVIVLSWQLAAELYMSSVQS